MLITNQSPFSERSNPFPHPSPQRKAKTSPYRPRENIQKKYPGLVWLYRSWVDQEEYRGLIDEQDLTKQIYSPFIRSGFLTRSSKGGRRLVHAGRQTTKYDLITVNLMTNKIFFRGAPVSSSDLPSQQYLCLILDVLRKRMGDKILNFDHCSVRPGQTLKNNCHFSIANSGSPLRIVME